MARYRVQDSDWGDDFDAADDDAALAYAQEWLRTGDWGDVSRTMWLEAAVLPLADDGDCGESIGKARLAIHPQPPKCRGEEHVWCSPYHILGGMKENPGVWGNGGGAKIKEVCSECGIYKLTDTWATNPVNGTQGHTSVEYLPADDRSLEWVDQLGSATEAVIDG